MLKTYITYIFDFIDYFSNDIIGLYQLNDLFGPTHPELGLIFYVSYIIQKYKFRK